MFTLKRWAAGAAMTGLLVLATQTALVAQQQAPPENGKALATQLGITGDAAKKMQPQLDKLARAMTQHARIQEQATKVRTDMQTALADIMPTLTPAQRQQLWGVMAQSRGGFGPGAGYGMRGGAGGMGPGMYGQGMRGMMGPGYGQGMRGGMGRGMHGYMHGQGMRGGAMGPGMRGQGYGPGVNCPFYQAPDSSRAPGAGVNPGPTGPGGR